MFDRARLILARLKAPVAFAAAMLLLWFAFESLLYRTGAYFAIAEPRSNTGAVVEALQRVRQLHRREARNVLVFGDSRVAEGFSARLASAHADDVSYIDVSVPGSTPRTWFYLLRAIDRAGYRFEAIVVGAPDESRNTRLDDWALDPAHQAPLVGLRDVLDYPTSFATPAMRARARQTVLLPALAMRQDTMAALAAPWKRWNSLRKYRSRHLADQAAYAGRPEHMPAIMFDAAGRVRDSRTASAAQLALVEAHLLELRAPRDAAVAAANRDYLANWLSAISRLAAQRGARVILFPLPRGPYREVLPPHPHLHAAQAAVAGHENAFALPPDLFDELERPDYFFDALHLNRAGRERLSATLGERVPTLLDARVH